MEPLLKWPAGKRWIADEVRKIYDSLKSSGIIGITEPFAGGASISMIIQPDSVQLNDVNKHLINLYHQIAINPSFSLNDIDVSNTKENYNQIKTQFNNEITSGAVTTNIGAQQFYFINRTCFRGMVRFNKHGVFNIVYGNYKKPIILSDFHQYHELLKNADLSLGSYLTLAVKPLHLLFSDPPYDDGFTSYHEDKFDWNDQVSHALWLAAQSNPIITTNKATPRIITLYKSLGFDVRTYIARRSISSKKGNCNELEMIAFKDISSDLLTDWIKV